MNQMNQSQSRESFLADASASSEAKAQSAVRMIGRDDGLNPALWRAFCAWTRSVVGRPPRPRDSSLRSVSRGRGGDY